MSKKHDKIETRTGPLGVGYRANVSVNGTQVKGGWTSSLDEAQADRESLLALRRPRPKKQRGLPDRVDRPKPKPVVYFIQAGENGPIKIGYTVGDPYRRLGTLQTAHHEHLRLVGTIAGNHEEEAALHVRFATDQVRGEWFSPSAELLRLIAQADPPIPKPTPAPKPVTTLKPTQPVSMPARLTAEEESLRELQNIDVPAVLRRLDRMRYPHKYLRKSS